MIKILGKNPWGDTKKSVINSPNYIKGEFKNLSKTVMMAEDSHFLGMMKEFIRSSNDRAPTKALPSIKRNLYEHINNDVAITWFGHSSYHINIEGQHILVDPVFSGNASLFSFMVKAFPGSNSYNENDFETVDVLVLTHDHYDHLDYYTLKALQKKVKAIYCSLGV